MRSAQARGRGRCHLLSINSGLLRRPGGRSRSSRHTSALRVLRGSRPRVRAAAAPRCEPPASAVSRSLASASPAFALSRTLCGDCLLPLHLPLCGGAARAGVTNTCLLWSANAFFARLKRLERSPSHATSCTLSHDSHALPAPPARQAVRAHQNDHARCVAVSCCLDAACSHTPARAAALSSARCPTAAFLRALLRLRGARRCRRRRRVVFCGCCVAGRGKERLAGSC